MSDLLRLENVKKWVGEGDGRVDILRGISLTLAAGEFVALMGASGSGKSTLLNLMGLLDWPSEGHLWLAGREVSTLHEDELASLRARTLGFIFQSFNLLPYLNARENVALPMGYLERHDASARSEELLRQMNLDHRIHAYPSTLSGGEKQRVAIARSLANEPALILADEPTGALDSTTGAQIMTLLKELNARGVAIVLVTHDPTVAQHASRTLRIKDGRIE